MTQPANSSARAQRFSLRMPMRYRNQGTSRWHSGRVINLSCSGILFSGRLEPASNVELVLKLPPQLTGRAEVNLLCSGHVVRVAPPRHLLAPAATAVAFDQFRVLPPEADLRVPELEPPLTPRVAHKLNNLLAVMLGNCELLLETPGLSSEVIAGLERIRESVAEAAAVIREQ